jgi:hypothetical protein
MQNDKLKVTLTSNCLYLGFTAILGALITISADAIVLFRKVIAVFLSILVFKKILKSKSMALSEISICRLG